MCDVLTFLILRNLDIWVIPFIYLVFKTFAISRCSFTWCWGQGHMMTSYEDMCNIVYFRQGSAGILLLYPHMFWTYLSIQVSSFWVLHFCFYHWILWMHYGSVWIQVSSQFKRSMVKMSGQIGSGYIQDRFIPEWITLVQDCFSYVPCLQGTEKTKVKVLKVSSDEWYKHSGIWYKI